MGIDLSEILTTQPKQLALPAPKQNLALPPPIQPTIPVLMPNQSTINKNQLQEILQPNAASLQQVPIVNVVKVLNLVQQLIPLEANTEQNEAANFDLGPADNQIVEIIQQCEKENEVMMSQEKIGSC